MNPGDQSIPSNTPTESWHRRHRGIVLGWSGITLFLLLLFALSQLQRYRVQRKIDARFAAIRAQGLPVTLGEANEYYKAVPASENGALVLIQFSNHLVDWDDIYAPWIGVLASNSVNYATNPITPAAFTALQSIVVSNQTALQYLHDATTNHNWRYPIDLNQGSGMLFTHLTKFRSSVGLLKLEALLHLAEGHPSQSISSLNTSFLVADSFASEPLLISFLVRRSYLDMTISNTEHLLARSEFSEQDLAKLQKTITTIEQNLDLLFMLRGERAFTTGTWHEPISNYVSGGFAPDAPFDHLPDFAQKIGWSIYEGGGYKQQDLLNYLELFDEVERLIHQGTAAALQQGKQIEKSLSSTNKPSMDMIMTTMLSGYLFQSMKINASLTARLRCAQTTLAVERFRLENHHLPQNLGEVIPRYLSHVPIDPYTDAPLLYRITTNGFRIYSVGENGQDDGGLTRHENSFANKSDDVVFLIEGERLKAP